MAISNKDRIQRMLGQLRDGLAPFIERELKGKLGDRWAEKLDERRQYPLQRQLDGEVAWDSQALLKTMIDNWQSVFRNTLGHFEQPSRCSLRRTHLLERGRQRRCRGGGPATRGGCRRTRTSQRRR